jgi:outer membrane protein assembly factor BamB
MYRHDPERTNATPSPAPGALEVLWQKALAGPIPDWPVAADWKEYLNSPLTAPVVAEGIIVAAATDRDQVIALDAFSGKELWRRAVGGRVDTPPTLHQGLCLFGSHDGYVYALSCKDGRVAWRVRAAPSEERMVSYGKVESPWPVVGTVLVADGIGYASAGQTQGSDGGIVVRAFDPTTGAISWSKVIAPLQNPGSYREMRKNDLMLKTGEAIQLMLTRMNPKTGEFVANPTHEYEKYLARLQQARLAAVRAKKPLPKPPEEPMTLTEIAPSIGLEGFMSWNWVRLGTRKFKTMDLGNIGGCMLSWGKQMVCANDQDGPRLSPGFFYLPRYDPTVEAGAKEGTVIRAMSREKVKPFGQKLDPKDWKWEAMLPAGYQATAVIVCGNGVVVGGGFYKKDATLAGGFVRVLSLNEGAQIAERTFAAPLTYNGMAVAGGRIYATLDDGSMLCLGKK